MKNITLCTINDKCRIFVAEDNETVADICGHTDVIEWLNNSDVNIASQEDVVKHFVAYQGANVPDLLKPAILGTVPDEGANIEFDIYVNAEWEEEAKQEADAQQDAGDQDATQDDQAGEDVARPAATSLPRKGTPGIVEIEIGGGLHIIPLPIVNGETTVLSAVYSNDVRQRTGMTDTQLSNCAVEYNGYKMDERLMRSKVVFDGDKIKLIAHVASDKG